MEMAREGALGNVCVLCADARFAHAMAHEVELLGHTAVILGDLSAVTEGLLQKVDLVLADGDEADDATWAALRGRSSCPWVMWARRTVTLPDVTVLRRPFDLGELSRVLLAALGNDRRIETLPRVPLGAESPCGESAYGATARGETARRETGMVRPIRVVSEGVLTIGGSTVALTPAEWAIYGCLAEHRGETVSREVLQALLGTLAGGNRVEVHMCHLRSKLEKPQGVRLIETVRGRGYRMV